MNLRIRDDIIIIALYIMSFVMILGQFIGQSMLTSISFALSFILVFSLWILHLRKTFSAIDLLTYAIIFISLLCAAITCERFTVEYFQKWLIFIVVFLYFSLCLKIRLSKTKINILFRINHVLSLICVLVYIFRYNNNFHITNTGLRYLIFNFHNSNAAALFLVCIVITGMLYYSFNKVKFKTIREICYIVVFLFLITQTRSRTSLIVLLFFIVISAVVSRKDYAYIPRNKGFYLFVSIFPLLFAIIYLYMIDLIEQKNFLSFLVSEGKKISSRQDVWTYAFYLFKTSPVVGLYGYIQKASTFTQMHNSHINVLVSYGVIVFVLVAVYLFMVLEKCISMSKGTAKVLSAWAFVLCLLLGTGEAILFSGGLSFYLLAGQFLLFCNSSVEDKEASLK